MNIQQMHIGVNLNVDRIASNSTSDLLPQEIDYYLNEAIEEYVKQQYSFLKIEEKNLEAQYASENLRTLITKQQISPSQFGSTVDTRFAWGGTFSTPNDYSYYISCYVLNAGEWKNTTKIDSKALKPFVVTKFNKPLFREFPIVFEGNTFTIVGDSSEDSGSPQALLTYVKKPNVVSLAEGVDCDLPDHTHREIVRLASNAILRDLREVAQGD